MFVKRAVITIYHHFLCRFCDDFYNFPLQKKVIDVTVAIAEKKYNMNKKLLIVVGSYMIGKMDTPYLPCYLYLRGKRRVNFLI